MAHLAVQAQIVGQVNHGPVNPRADEALLQEVLEQVAILALLAADPRARAGHAQPAGEVAHKTTGSTQHR